LCDIPPGNQTFNGRYDAVAIIVRGDDIALETYLKAEGGKTYYSWKE
jgi:hypothetical protein